MSAPARAWDKRGLGQPLQGGVVVHVAILDVAAVAVAGVLAITDVGDDQEHVGNFPSDGAEGALHDAVLVVGAGGHVVLGFGQSEENDAADAERLDFDALLDHLVDGHLVVTGHGADFAADALAGADEKREDELAGVEVRLADEAAKPLGGPKATEAVSRKRHHPDCNPWYRSPFSGTGGLDKGLHVGKINLI